jgi:hypothetical protein
VRVVERTAVGWESGGLVDLGDEAAEGMMEGRGASVLDLLWLN